MSTFKEQYGCCHCGMVDGECPAHHLVCCRVAYDNTSLQSTTCCLRRREFSSTKFGLLQMSSIRTCSKAFEIRSSTPAGPILHVWNQRFIQRWFGSSQDPRCLPQHVQQLTCPRMLSDAKGAHGSVCIAALRRHCCHCLGPKMHQKSQESSGARMVNEHR